MRLSVGEYYSKVLLLHTQGTLLRIRIVQRVVRRIFSTKKYIILDLIKWRDVSVIGESDDGGVECQ
jgi:hypothetical protein